MPIDTERDVIERSPTDRHRIEQGDRGESAEVQWSPSQLVGLVVGICITVLGFVALARTGFNTDNIYSPHAQAWRLPHSPLLALIEVGFGMLLIVGAVVPGGMRSLFVLLGAVALAFGIVVVSMTPPDRLNHWLGVDDKNGWFFVVVGGVLLVAGLVFPRFKTRTRVDLVRDERHVLV